MSDDMIDLDALEAQMKAVNKQIEELQRANIETSKRVFHAAVSAFFKKYPEVYAVTWTQYTPYFNDGEACEFSVHEPSFLSMEGFDETDARDVYEYSSWAKPSSWVYEAVANKDNKYGYLERYIQEIADYEAMEREMGPRLGEIQEGIDKFERMFKSINDDTMLSLFGDHVRVTATAKEIIVDEYDHE